MFKGTHSLDNILTTIIEFEVRIVYTDEPALTLLELRIRVADEPETTIAEIDTFIHYSLDIAKER